MSHTVVAAAQQTLAELVEGDLGQRLSKPLLSWWKESVPRERESDSATLAESQERQLSKPLMSWWSDTAKLC